MTLTINKNRLIFLIQIAIWLVTGLATYFFMSQNAKPGAENPLLWKYSLLSNYVGFLAGYLMTLLYHFLRRLRIKLVLFVLIVILASFGFAYLQAISGHLFWMLLRNVRPIIFLWEEYAYKAWQYSFVFLFISMLYIFIFCRDEFREISKQIFVSNRK